MYIWHHENTESLVRSGGTLPRIISREIVNVASELWDTLTQGRGLRIILGVTAREANSVWYCTWQDRTMCGFLGQFSVQTSIPYI